MHNLSYIRYFKIGKLDLIIFNVEDLKDEDVVLITQA